LIEEKEIEKGVENKLILHLVCRILNEEIQRMFLPSKIAPTLGG
jgi:hypothetical protein